MTVLAVTFDGTRLDDSDSNTDWDNYNTTGGSPASEFPLAYQVTSGTTSGAVNKKVNSSSQRQGVERYNGTGHNMAATDKLWFCKVYVADAFDLNATWGVEVNMGSGDNSNKHVYNIAGTGANLSVYNQYPAQGGYLITSIDPNIDTWRESESGTYAQAATRFFAVGAQFINGTAKTENVAMDSIDVGTGLTIVSGTGADPAGTFPDFVEEDQNDKTNRWGVVTGSGDNVIAHGILTIGSATETDFQDSTSVVRYPDGYHSRGLVGVDVALSNASSIVIEGALHLGEGTRNGVDANDTRPDYTVTGTTATTSEFTHTLRNFRDVTYTSACDVHDVDIECHLLTQASADIYDSVIRCNALTSVACLQDPTFGTTTDLHDVTFIQAGAGHALEIDTAGDYTATNIEFSGFNASNSQPDSAIDVTAGTGTVNITVSGGASANYTYNSAGATVNILTSVLVTINVVDEAGNDVNTAQTSVYLTADDTQVMNEDTVSGTATEAFTGSTPAACYIRVRKGSTGSTKYIPASTTGTIESSTGLTTTVVLREDSINAT